MKKKLLLPLLLLSTAALAQERTPHIENDPALVVEAKDIVKTTAELFTEKLRKVEIYYNYSENERALHEAGLKGTVSLHDCSEADKASGVYFCPRKDVKYARVGVVDFAVQHVRNKRDTESAVQLQQISIKLNEYMTNDGFYRNYMRIGYIKNNRSRFIDFQIPLTILTVSQNVDIKMDSKGVARIFIQGWLEGGLQFTKYNEKLNTPGNASAVGVSFPYAAAGGQAGLKIGKMVEMGGLVRGHADFQTVGGNAYEAEYGGRINLKLGRKVSFFADGTSLHRWVPADVFNPGDNSTMKENYWYAGGGLKVDF